jgi:hypothetical protein
LATRAPVGYSRGMHDRRVGVLLAAMLPLGCSDFLGDKGDAHQPGTVLGKFHVAAALQSSTCGQGALGAEANWEFDVELARDDGALYWNNGVEIITGQLAADRTTFTFSSAVIVDMRTEETLGMPPCSVRRDDTATGALDSPNDPVHAFTGALGYAFAATVDSECSDLVPPSETATFATLPCSMSYAVQADRSD